MPNWCSNKLTLSHDDPKQILRVLTTLAVLDAREDEVRAVSDAIPGLLGEFLPMPISIATSKVEVKNERGYSEPAWYVWALDNWGTKWDVFSAWLADEEDCPNNANRVTIGFRTAWTPPVLWLEHMGELGFTCWMRFFDYPGFFAGLVTNENPERIMRYSEFAFDSPAFEKVFGKDFFRVTEHEVSFVE